jgi:multiple sugar transport system substrate-binding protein
VSDPERRFPTPEELAFSRLTRATLLKRGGGGLLGLSALGVLASACGGSSSSSSSSSSAAASTAAGSSSSSSAAAGGGGHGTVTFGSNASDPQPKNAYAATFKAFESGSDGTSVKVNTVDHNTFQDQISTYLQGNPDDVFTWFAGYRMRFFAAKGLTGDISDVWGDIGSHFSDATKAQATGDDGKQYLVPIYVYPWGVFYKKSFWAEKGYTAPTTWDDFITLVKKMKTDGNPMGMADKDGWPAMGTFDYINMRTNGYQFHVDLMAHKEPWDSPKVKATFTNWAQLAENYNPGGLGKTWQQGATEVHQGKAGALVQGMSQIATIFPGKDLDDLDFFLFPEIDAANGQDAIEAPMDGLMMAKKPKNEDGAKQLLRYLGTPQAEATYLAIDPSNIAVAKDADTSKYAALQQKAATEIGKAKQISQFLDRDSRPDFASTVAIPSFQSFLKDTSSGSIASIMSSMEKQAKTIFAS